MPGRRGLDRRELRTGRGLLPRSGCRLPGCGRSPPLLGARLSRRLLDGCLPGRNLSGGRDRPVRRGRRTPGGSRGLRAETGRLVGLRRVGRRPCRVDARRGVLLRLRDGVAHPDAARLSRRRARVRLDDRDAARADGDRRREPAGPVDAPHRACHRRRRKHGRLLRTCLRGSALGLGARGRLRGARRRLDGALRERPLLLGLGCGHGSLTLLDWCTHAPRRRRLRGSGTLHGLTHGRTWCGRTRCRHDARSRLRSLGGLRCLLRASGRGPLSRSGRTGRALGCRSSRGLPALRRTLHSGGRTLRDALASVLVEGVLAHRTARERRHLLLASIRRSCVLRGLLAHRTLAHLPARQRRPSAVVLRTGHRSIPGRDDAC